MLPSDGDVVDRRRDTVRNSLESSGDWRASLRAADGWRTVREPSGPYATAPLLEWGSITKGLAGTTAWRTLDVERPVVYYLPRVPDVEMTVEDLVRHTSGLPRLPATMRGSLFGDPYLKAVGVPLDLAAAVPVTPRGRFVYSNLGYALLGAVLDEVHGDWFAAAREHVLKPTGICSATLVPDPAERVVPKLFGRPITPWALAEAEAAWPYVQDAAAVAGNVFASMGNAMVNHPDEMIELLGGLATMAGGAAMEGGGVALDITGVGAIAGVPLNISGAAVMAAGATAAAAGASQLGVHAMTDGRVSPNRTDHVEQAKKDPNGPNENHPGRNNKGEYRSEDNDKARADSAQKEAQGLKQYEEQRGVDVDVTRVRASQDGADRVRYYDGLVKKSDGTYEGIEVKSGTSKDASQEAFDNGVSYDKPA
jgi:hypothetical protein